ncbi:hypothetical protein PBRA_005463 [Plasmodiophora brassicae]|uniref:Uncharacterized protein n=1 Tax=Plasmodiophora brassicae TaxID=37360 RepID=A0A0G4INT8_PLABS|nr:hypothetical protein PBRA_005463 [Plasmodiophora brassicae]
MANSSQRRRTELQVDEVDVVVQVGEVQPLLDVPAGRVLSMRTRPVPGRFLAYEGDDINDSETSRSGLPLATSVLIWACISRRSDTKLGLSSGTPHLSGTPGDSQSRSMPSKPCWRTQASMLPMNVARVACVATQAVNAGHVFGSTFCVSPPNDSMTLMFGFALRT